MSISAMICFFRWGKTTFVHCEMWDTSVPLPNDEATPVKVAASSGKGGFFSSVYGDSR